ncbi:MAG: transposase [Snodgrassella sp.]|nr:transposase [Snodgrassella sp.]
MPVKELCDKYGLENATLYQWRDQYDGMETSDSTCFKQLETENRKLKQMLAKLSLKAQLQEQIINKFSIYSRR